MTDYNLTLSTTEANSVGMVKLRHADTNSQILKVQVIENGIAKKFTGLTPFFCLMAQSVTGQGVSEEPVKTFNSAKGTLEYIASDNALQMIGRNEAYFSFRKQTGTEWVEQFSTRSFYFVVEESVYSQPFKDSNYWWTFKELYRLFLTYIEQGKQSWEDFVNENRDILESIDPGGKILTELIDARKDIEGNAFPSLGDRLNSQEKQNKDTYEKLESSSDYLTHLNRIQVIGEFQARGEDEDSGTWVQGINYIEERDVLIVSNTTNGSDFIRLDLRTVQGEFIESKTITVGKGSYTENIPYFFNSDGELCLILRAGGTDETYSIYNYDLEELGVKTQIKGNYKSTVWGDSFLSTDAADKAISNFYLYQWEDIKNGTPNDPFVIPTEYVANGLVKKTQGILAVDSAIIVSLGGANDGFGLSIFHNDGRLLKEIVFDLESYVEAINQTATRKIPTLASYKTENEGIFLYKNKFVLIQIVEGRVYLVQHNVPFGNRFDFNFTKQRALAPFETPELMEGILPYSDLEIDQPRIRRDGNRIIMDGAVKGITQQNQEVFKIYSGWVPERHIYFFEPTSAGARCTWVVRNTGKIAMMKSELTDLSKENWYPFHFEWTLG